MATVRRIHWLVREEDRALRAHVLLGDEIAFGDSGDAAWFAPCALGPVSGGSSILMLRYECGDEALLFCLLPPKDFGPREVCTLRASASLEGAEQIWRPFVERLGPGFASSALSRSWQETSLSWGGGDVRVRRARHGHHVIDRLLMRERHRALGPFGGQAA